MRIKNFNEMALQIDMTDFFISNLQAPIMEDKENSTVKDIIKKTGKDLKLNLSIINTYGTGITLMYPIIMGLIANSSLSIDITPEKIALLTLTVFTIIYMEEAKSKSPEEQAKLKKDSKSMLEELKLNGIGNGIVKKLILCVKSIKSIFNLIYKNIGKIAEYLVDMFAYTALLIPFLNAIGALITKFQFNIDTLPGNFLSLGVGVGTLIAKNGISFIIDKIKSKINKKEVLGSIDTKKGDHHVDDDHKTELIKEKR